MTTENNTGKKAAITAYFTVFGTIIAFFLNFDIKNFKKFENKIQYFSPSWWSSILPFDRR